MHVAMLQIDLEVNSGTNAAEKRRLMHEILERLHRHFNVSVAEANPREGGPGARVGVAVVARSRREARKVLDRVTEAVGVHPHAELVAHTIQDL
jgi:uncharacterized protein YlxP (DUF503 family)